jgi:hypothetical protein
VLDAWLRVQADMGPQQDFDLAARLEKGAAEAEQWRAFDQSHRRSPLPEHLHAGAPSVKVERVGPDTDADPVRTTPPLPPKEPSRAAPSRLRIEDTREPS